MTKKVKIGLLLNSTKCSWYLYDLISWIKKQNFIEISAIFIIKSKVKKQKILDRIFFGLINFIEKKTILKKYQKFKNFFLNQDISSENIQIVELLENINKYEICESDIEKIKQFELDFLFRGCSNILKGEILKSTKNGIISFHHGDNRKYRGWPAGFWEVYNNDPQTGFILQIIDDEIDNGYIVKRGNFITKTFYLLNQKTLYERSNFYIKKFFIDYYQNNEFVKSKEKIKSKIYTFPKYYHSILYVLKILLKKLKNLLHKNLIINEWSTSFSETDFNNFNIQEYTEIKNPKNTFLADPFFTTYENKKFLFAEEYDYKKNKGRISVYNIEGKSYKKLGTALEENFHLSFPYLFKFDNQIYLMPETKEINEIRIYKSLKFPLKWEFYKTIKKNIPAVDSMIFKYNDLWWLFTNFSPTGNSPESELNIFFSENGPLTDNWKAHKLNPIVTDSFSARNAGLVLKKDLIYRCAHYIDNFYIGKKTKIYEIIELTDKTYIEKQVAIIEPEKFSNAFSTHHLFFKDNLLLFDYCRKKLKFLYNLKKIFKIG